MDIFVKEDGNEVLMSLIKSLPEELENNINDIFLLRMMFLNPVPFKDELSVVFSKKYCDFISLFETKIGLARVYAKIQVIYNILSSKYINEDFDEIFNDQIGFRPTLEIKNRLHKLQFVPPF